MPKFKCDILSIFQIQCDTVQIQDLLFYVFLNDLWFSKVSWLSTNKINEGGKIGLRRILSWRNPISISKKANFHKNVIYDGFSGLIPHTHIVWKLLKMSHLNFWILTFSTNFCPMKTDLSGNTVWPQASGFQKLAKMDHFWHF